MTEPHPGKAASGVEALIQRLRAEGVAKGEAEAQARVDDAERRAREILDRANAEAESVLQAARSDSERLEVAGREALDMAFRDTVIRLRDELTRRFRQEVGRLIGQELDQPEFIRALLLQLAGSCREGAQLDREPRLLVHLPTALVGLEELRSNPEELAQGSLTQLVSSIAGNLLRDGVEFAPAGGPSRGIRLTLQDGAMQVDLSDEVCASLLLEHLQPRFRALLEGVVK